MTERETFDKLIKGTNLWIERDGRFIVVTYLGHAPHDMPRLMRTHDLNIDSVFAFVEGFKACLRHVNEMEID